MLGIDIFDASILPAALVSVLAGLISFLSPCVLPIVPPYLAYMSGISLDNSSQKRNVKVILVATSFV
ncbi:cytochrome c biogenesis protein CcdA, partial [bacterium]|nr:cytochrome c biogenesis protein CcdA [bacterium]